ncbi:MAG: hypothetical protein V5A45_02555 [Haloarculaceae archaeon]
MSRVDDAGFLSALACYLPGLLTIVLTLGVSVSSHLPVARPGLLTSVVLAVPPAALLASVAVWSDWGPSGVRLLVAAVLAWAVFSVARIPLLDPAATRIVGSPLALLDFGLVWLGSYAISGAVVYCIDWPTVESDTERDRSQPGFADD